MSPSDHLMRYSSIKKAFLLFVVAASAFLFACQATSTPGKTAATIPGIDTVRIKNLNQQALNFCKKKGFNSEFCIFIDMSIHSGKNRFLVWDFEAQKIKEQALVTHGCGTSGWGVDESSINPVFSNVPESHCSSLGRYKIGEKGYSQWGIHVKYLLHGLDTSNSNALSRTIVLHSWEAVPDKEIYPRGAPESWGCPAVSNNFMKKLDTLLSASTKPVLLWMVN